MKAGNSRKTERENGQQPAFQRAAVLCFPAECPEKGSTGIHPIGLALGFCFRATKKLSRSVIRLPIQIAAIVASVALGILVIKSETESLLYAQPFLVRAAKNSYAFAADVAVLILSLPVCAILDRQAKKLFPVEKKSGQSA